MSSSGEPSRSPEPAIRPERSEDADAIEAVVRAAFGGDVEPAIVRASRHGPGWDPARSLVAVALDGRIVGHVLLSACRIEDEAHATVATVLAIGPIAVVPDAQGQGIGGSLMRAAIARAEAEDAPAIVLLGHPTYYPRFGFRPARALGLRPPEDWPDAAWMALPLRAWTPTIAGTVRYPSAFGLETQTGD